MKKHLPVGANFAPGVSAVAGCRKLLGIPAVPLGGAFR